MSFAEHYTESFSLRVNRIYQFVLSYFLLSVNIKGSQLSYTNPIIPGSYPDPSIYRVGDDYYIVFISSLQEKTESPVHHLER